MRSIVAPSPAPQPGALRRIHLSLREKCFQIHAGLQRLVTQVDQLRSFLDAGKMLRRYLERETEPIFSKDPSPSTVGSNAITGFRVAFAELFSGALLRVSAGIYGRFRNAPMNNSAQAREAKRPRIHRDPGPDTALLHVPLCAADAARSRRNIARWNSYLPAACVRSMTRMGWDYTT